MSIKAWEGTRSYICIWTLQVIKSRPIQLHHYVGFPIHRTAFSSVGEGGAIPLPAPLKEERIQ